MIDYTELMRILSVPRPNGSAAERETARALCDWLGRRGIRYHVHGFRLYPYFNEAIGLWIIRIGHIQAQVRVGRGVRRIIAEVLARPLTDLLVVAAGSGQQAQTQE